MSIEQTNANAREVIRRHSRSFSIASRLLPARVRTSVFALYAWCRTVDDAVDEASGKDDAERILNVLEDDLDRMRQGQAPHHAASVWIEPLVVERRIDVKHAKELIAGMRLDLQSFRVNNDADLQLYCYHAAGTVGRMMTRLMGVHDLAADRHAIALGVAMQLTNIARDVREDAERGRSYLPGISDPMTADPQVVRIAVADVLATADRQYAVATAGLKYLPWDCRFAIRIALVLYREIGRQIQRNECEVMFGRTVVPGPRLMWVLLATLAISMIESFKLALSSIPQLSNERKMIVQYLFCDAPYGSLRGERYRTLISRPIQIQETPMNDTKLTEISTVAQAKHVVYLGLSLTAIMAAALFVMVFMNPKDAVYSNLPLVYSAASMVGAILFNRMAARCDIAHETPAG